jgi:hypothetical protein
VLTEGGREELRASWSRYRQAVRDELECLVATIKGIHYELADIWDVVERVHGADVSFFASVPHYAHGYDKMFRTPNLAWNEPHVPHFDPKDFPKLFEKFEDSRCCALIYRHYDWSEQIPESWQKVFGSPDGRRAVWIIANRSMQAYAENDTGRFPLPGLTQNQPRPIVHQHDPTTRERCEWRATLPVSREIAIPPTGIRFCHAGGIARAGRSVSREYSLPSAGPCSGASSPIPRREPPRVSSPGLSRHP